MNPFLIIIGIVIGSFLFLKKGSAMTKNYTLDLSTVSQSLLSRCGVIIDKHYETFRSIKNKHSLNIPVQALLAILHNESGSLQHKLNHEIVGDSGTAFGYMQIRKLAMIDVNNNYNLNFTLNDLHNDYYKNLEAGSLYAELCYKKALKQSINPIKLTFKKYNGGIDETDSSLNLLADKYADKAFYNYTIYNTLIQV